MIHICIYGKPPGVGKHDVVDSVLKIPSTQPWSLGLLQCPMRISLPVLSHGPGWATVPLGQCHDVRRLVEVGNYNKRGMFNSPWEKTSWVDGIWSTAWKRNTFPIFHLFALFHPIFFTFPIFPSTQHFCKDFLSLTFWSMTKGQKWLRNSSSTSRHPENPLSFSEKTWQIQVATRETDIHL